MKVSIITVCKNAEDTIEQTIKSVLSQTYKNIEYIIIDGKSEDNTLKIISKYKKFISHFIAQKDKGIYDAMNNGISLVSGNILLFLNANDTYYDSSIITRIIDTFRHNNVDIVFGDIIMVNPQNNKSFYKKYSSINRSFFYYHNLPHQSSAYKISLFKQYGLFDDCFKVLADYDWSLRVFSRESIHTYYIHYPFSIFSIGGVSTNQKYFYIRKKESKEIRKKYFTLLERLQFRLSPTNLIKKIYWETQLQEIR